LLNKLLVAEFTKSRAYRTTDNALVEGKRSAVARKHFGHEPIGAEHAAELQRFYMVYFDTECALRMQAAKRKLLAA
jgi:hypothetical protein